MKRRKSTAEKKPDHELELKAKLLKEDKIPASGNLQVTDHPREI